MALQNRRDVGDRIAEFIGDIVQREGTLLIIRFDVMANMSISVIDPRCSLRDVDLNNPINQPLERRLSAIGSLSGENFVNNSHVRQIRCVELINRDTTLKNLIQKIVHDKEIRILVFDGRDRIDHLVDRFDGIVSFAIKDGVGNRLKLILIDLADRISF